MTDIKELALRVALEMPTWGAGAVIPENFITDFAQRFLAAYIAEQEPVARVIDNGTAEGATEWVPFTSRLEPLKTGDLLFTAPPEPAPKETALSKYKRLEVEHETTDPVERLRAFCSLAMDGQDWLDVEQFLDALTEPAPQEPDINSMRPKPAPIVCAAPSSEEVREMAKYLYSIDEHIAADMIERLAARVHEQRIATLEQQNAELVTALKAIKGRVCGEAMPNWENTPNTGYSRGLIADEVDIALSKVKQP